MPEANLFFFFLFSGEQLREKPVDHAFGIGYLKPSTRHCSCSLLFTLNIQSSPISKVLPLAEEQKLKCTWKYRLARVVLQSCCLRCKQQEKRKLLICFVPCIMSVHSVIMKEEIKGFFPFTLLFETYVFQCGWYCFRKQ